MREPALEPDLEIPAEKVLRESIRRFFDGEAPYGVLGSLRQDRSPFANPLGWWWDGDSIYVSIGAGRGGDVRLRREPRASFLLVGTGALPDWIRLEGRFEPVADLANDLSVNLMRRNMERVPGLDIDTFQANWLTAGRTVLRLAVERSVLGRGLESHTVGG